MNVFDTTIEAGHEDEVGMAIAAICYSHLHVLEDIGIRELLPRKPRFSVPDLAEPYQEMAAHH